MLDIGEINVYNTLLGKAHGLTSRGETQLEDYFKMIRKKDPGDLIQGELIHDTVHQSILKPFSIIGVNYKIFKENSSMGLMDLAT